MKDKIYLILILILIFFVYPQEEVFYYTAEQVYKYLDSQGLEDYQYKEIIDYLSKIFNNTYAFHDIAMDPPQPYFDDEYHSKVDILKNFEEMNYTDIGIYEFYRRIASSLAPLRDAHIQMFFNDDDFSEFYITHPFDYFVGEYHEKPRLFAKCNEEVLLDRFENYSYLENYCDVLDQMPIIKINGQDPFEYINNFCGTFISTKNDHGTFSFKLRLNNFVSLSDCLFDFKENYSDFLLIGFEDGDSILIIKTRYMFTSEIEIPEENNYLRALSSRKGFNHRDFYLNKGKNNKKNKNIKNTEKNKNTKKKKCKQ